ncbi:hypothetical protein ZIOFF_055031 [Zingiber officinale]|uniref:C3H1-type domain-containing protein n=2 Tax=Zingiber officinale TaxID=94328 RepID=A0A8J5KN67_ZINOF|nr:hypothetical protein ZIOFF_055031 [Zingiber officinale]
MRSAFELPTTAENRLRSLPMASSEPMRLRPSVRIPLLWSYSDDVVSLQRFLPCNGSGCADSCGADQFRMYEFKVRRCGRGRAHDWTECPFAHPGEKARRRDPRRYHYSGAPCPDFRRGGGCRRGDACDLAHGVFETWLHPARYRTQACKDGAACRRRVCFFAHSPDQLRIVLTPGKGSASPKSTLVSPLSELASGMSKLKLSKAKSLPPSRGRGDATFAAAQQWEAPAGRWRQSFNILDEWKQQEDEASASAASLPDLGWVSELVKD